MEKGGCSAIPTAICHDVSSFMLYNIQSIEYEILFESSILCSRDGLKARCCCFLVM